jgi:capsular polysaccharide biosynthesis protein
VSAIDFVESLFGHWVPAAVVVVVTLVATTLIGMAQPRTYAATATVLVGHILDAAPDYNEVLRAQRLAPTYAALVTTRPVADAVAHAVAPGRDPGDLLASVSAVASIESPLIRITARDSEPVVAAALANAFAAQLVAISAPPAPSTTTSSVTVVDAAVAPTGPDTQPTVLIWVAGAAGALVLGLAVVLVLGLRDARARRLPNARRLAA